jgi:hypothetical protein
MDMLHLEGVTGGRDRVRKVCVTDIFLPFALNGFMVDFLRNVIEPYVGIWPTAACRQRWLRIAICGMTASKGAALILAPKSASNVECWARKVVAAATTEE